MMDITYSHVKQRRHFGKMCAFSDVGPHLTVDIEPDPELKKEFVYHPFTEKEIQCSGNMSVHEVNTVQRTTMSTSMNHIVGGWPVDIEYKDKDQVSRFTKKLQKEENFIDSVKTLADQVETFIMENNSVNIYEEYFMKDDILGSGEAQCKTLNVFRDLSNTKRKVLDLSWSLDGCKIAGAYFVEDILANTTNFCSDCYTWDIENCNFPYCTLEPDRSLCVVEYSPRDLELLLGGQSNGQIALWDARVGGLHQQITDINESHKETVSDITWITSKTGLEFFSISTDGKLYCWDSRNMNKPILMIPLIQQSSGSCYSLTRLEYDTTLPNSFMVGTEEGVIISCSRKCKDPKDSITGSYSSRNGPVLDISRNTFFSKLFASCSSYGVEVWSEDHTESPMIILKCTGGHVTDAVWSQLHPSFLLMTKTTGHLELWDILVKDNHPILSVKLESEGLTSLKYRQHSNQVACATRNGLIHLVDVPEYSTFSAKQEKNLVAAMIDREGKRERIIEGINREQKIQQKQPGKRVDIPENLTELEMNNENERENSNDEFNSTFEVDVQEDDVQDFPEEPLHDSLFAYNLRCISKLS